MEANSVEKFKINHFRQRIAQMTVAHEDMVAEAAVQKQLFVQERDALQKLVEQKDLEIAELHAELAELRPAPEEETPETPPEDSPEGDD